MNTSSILFPRNTPYTRKEAKSSEREIWRVFDKTTSAKSTDYKAFQKGLLLSYKDAMMVENT